MSLLMTGCQSLKEQLSRSGAEPSGSGGAGSTHPAGVSHLDPGWELAPSATYSATQVAGEVTIVARGENPSAGYETKLVQSPLRIWPPQHLLAVKPPDGPAATVMTPFEVTTSVKADDPIESVSVRDARGLQKVAVKREKPPATGPFTAPSR
jgi:hypothetical protein